MGLESQVKDPAKNVTGLQKYFVTGKVSVALLSEKAAVLPVDRQSSALDIDSLLFDRCRDHNCREHTWIDQKKVIRIWRLSPLGQQAHL